MKCNTTCYSLALFFLSLSLVKIFHNPRFILHVEHAFSVVYYIRSRNNELVTLFPYYSSGRHLFAYPSENEVFLSHTYSFSVAYRRTSIILHFDRVNIRVESLYSKSCFLYDIRSFLRGYTWCMKLIWQWHSSEMTKWNDRYCISHIACIILKHEKNDT